MSSLDAYEQNESDQIRLCLDWMFVNRMSQIRSDQIRLCLDWMFVNRMSQIRSDYVLIGCL